MLMRKPLSILGSLTIVGLILVVLSLNSIASQETVVLSDAQLMTVQGGACDRDCNDTHYCRRSCTPATLTDAKGKKINVWIKNHATRVDVCGELKGSKEPCPNHIRYICAYIWAYPDSSCKSGGWQTNLHESVLGCDGFEAPI